MWKKVASVGSLLRMDLESPEGGLLQPALRGVEEVRRRLRERDGEHLGGAKSAEAGSAYWKLREGVKRGRGSKPRTHVVEAQAHGLAARGRPRRCERALQNPQGRPTGAPRRP